MVFIAVYICCALCLHDGEGLREDNHSRPEPSLVPCGKLELKGGRSVHPPPTHFLSAGQEEKNINIWEHCGLYYSFIHVLGTLLWLLFVWDAARKEAPCANETLERGEKKLWGLGNWMLSHSLQQIIVLCVLPDALWEEQEGPISRILSDFYFDLRRHVPSGFLWLLWHRCFCAKLLFNQNIWQRSSEKYKNTTTSSLNVITTERLAPMCLFIAPQQKNVFLHVPACARFSALLPKRLMTSRWMWMMCSNIN